MTAAGSADKLDTLREMTEADVLQTMTDRCYPLKRTAKAHRYVETGRKQGNVLVTMENPAETR